MAAYAQKAKEIAERVNDFCKVNNLTADQKVAICQFVLSGAKAMPWRGATYKVKTSFGQELGRHVEGVLAKLERREGREGESDYNVVIFGKEPPKF